MTEIETISAKTSPYTGSKTQQNETLEETDRSKYVHCDCAFMKSPNGITIAAECILSFLGIVIVKALNEGCANSDFFVTVSAACLVTSGIWYCLFGFTITFKETPGCAYIIEGLWSAVFMMLYLMSTLLMFNERSHDKCKATIVFGFLCAVPMILNICVICVLMHFKN